MFCAHSYLEVQTLSKVGGLFNTTHRIGDVLASLQTIKSCFLDVNRSNIVHLGCFCILPFV